MSQWQLHQRISYVELRPYVKGEPMRGIGFNQNDELKEGGMIARNPHDHTDMWYINEEYFKMNYQPVSDWIINYQKVAVFSINN